MHSLLNKLKSFHIKTAVLQKTVTAGLVRNANESNNITVLIENTNLIKKEEMNHWHFFALYSLYSSHETGFIVFFFQFVLLL